MTCFSKAATQAAQAISAAVVSAVRDETHLPREPLHFILISAKRRLAVLDDASREHCLSVEIVQSLIDCLKSSPKPAHRETGVCDPH